MSVTDSIGDMLTRIRNACVAKQETVEIPSSRVKVSIAKIFYEEGYISKYEELSRGSKKIIKIALKYRPNKMNVISKIIRISSPGKHIYKDRNSLPRVLRGFGTAIISTSSGIMTDKAARKLRIGGEVMCYVW